MAPNSYREFAASLIETLEALDLQYAIGGSFASSAYGEARTTVDIDIALVTLPVPRQALSYASWAMQERVLPPSEAG